MSIIPQPIQLTAIIPESLHGLRLDQALAQLFPAYSRSRLQTWIKNQQVKVDHAYLRNKDKIAAGQHVAIDADPLSNDNTWEAQSIPLDIVYEDTSLIVLNKPAGLVVHPAAGNWDSTLLNALLYHEPALQHIPRAGIVHRLDKDTSGLLVIAKTLSTHTYLTSMIQARQMKREYQALIQGTPTAGGTIDAPIGRHHSKRTHMAVTPSGKPAITHYRVLEKFRAHTHLKVTLETGRTHQIRVHMAHIGHPILGDHTYGSRLKLPAQCSPSLADTLRQFKRQALHAWRLTLQHPETHTEMTWEVAPPDDFQQLLTVLKQSEN